VGQKRAQSGWRSKGKKKSVCVARFVAGWAAVLGAMRETRAARGARRAARGPQCVACGASAVSARFLRFESEKPKKKREA